MLSAQLSLHVYENDFAQQCKNTEKPGSSNMADCVSEGKIFCDSPLPWVNREKNQDVLSETSAECVNWADKLASVLYQFTFTCFFTSQNCDLIIFPALRSGEDSESVFVMISIARWQVNSLDLREKFDVESKISNLKGFRELNDVSDLMMALKL